MYTSSQLIDLVHTYDPDANGDLIRKAYIFAMESHGMQKRASGSPYFYHPAEVARILGELHMDVATVVTGLLHDVIEDTNVSFEEIGEIFGTEIAFLIEGVTKLSKISYTSSQVRQTENFRKFLMAITQDIRVLVVKLVDRLHNMRTLNYIPSSDKRKRIALESLEIYAPLAERVGMNVIKDEIEDIAFFNLHPNEYRIITQKLDLIRSQDEHFVENTILALRKVFSDSGIHATITGREKTAYSIWKKMQKQNVNLEQIHDIIAFRVIVRTVEQCYMALGVIHTNFQIMPGRFKDYISIPKLNNYRSLHTTVIGPFKQPVEVQIRTEEMHRVAEEGIAAHWSYKNGDIVAGENDPKNYNWIRSLIAILQNSGSANEIMDNSKLEMFEDEVFCFTTKGDLITLPKGATAVDFAYEIHTEIGNTCIGVRINEKMVPLKTVLRNGDRVDILTSPYQHPEASWDSFVVTGKAHSCIRKFIRSQEQGEYISLGFHLTKYVFDNACINFSENLINLRKFNCEKLNDFYSKVGRGLILPNAIRVALPSEENMNLYGDASICLIDYVPGIAVHFAECCHPIMGDKIIGVIQPKKGLEIHVTSCSQLENQVSQNFIKVKWSQENDEGAAFIARLRIVMLNKQESFALVTNIISSNGGSIANLKIEHRSSDFFSLLIDIKVTDMIRLGEIQAALRACSNIKSVRRM
ncbi:MAG: bifunctional (p)ppGpp synthetase/guanosine-3',5'-bis(diphosphate) 3'-pyrophosphohydrolase [Alphaproteobacteria bacterium]|nr:bifunctional (p)ppGpp synthetase/guanosine-3',5'-bis(diphosphate) 3'-pyrophosphohydrolase [Alphaproteobacteria bacterium]MBO7537326.1 bifunctional (p)ppGpp synthetase/guanosine-3',5'-bis(diphosphate) 3'-pyrophosphohydrolase [Alphaproteobacteria bacterium]MBO7641798.1 bifunctional (p)ppGpp synthetase/guanosine-3',5'-bis(diphosphate) 3'-pyrophosphohydrolase [Alphaproteobacteria bacterium]